VPPPAYQREQPESGERSPRRGGMAGKSVWFRLNAGRQKNADPRWLLPMICRLGKITKQDIGAIRIFERDTKFEVVETVAEKFMAAVAQVDKPEVRIERLAEGPGEGEQTAPRNRSFAKKTDGAARPAGKERWKGKPPRKPNA
jgi:ATP-dependent RNA helicase DeaD